MAIKSKQQTKSIDNILGLKYTEFIHVEPKRYKFQNEKFIESGSEHFPESFYACKYPVTQELYYKVMGHNSSRFKGKYRPVENVSWYDAQEFIKKLNTRDQEETYFKGEYKLPHEHMWEYCARNQSWDSLNNESSDESHFSGSQILSEVGWYDKNSNRMTQPVGMKQPNELGLFDMSGNVWEWMLNDYDTLSIDLKNKESSRGLRGGCWYNGDYFSRVRYRDWNDAAGQSISFGFRLFRY